jgi:hypothetical protein
MASGRLIFSPCTKASALLSLAKNAEQKAA